MAESPPDSLATQGPHRSTLPTRATTFRNGPCPTLLSTMPSFGEVTNESVSRFYRERALSVPPGRRYHTRPAVPDPLW